MRISKLLFVCLLFGCATSNSSFENDIKFVRAIPHENKVVINAVSDDLKSIETKDYDDLTIGLINDELTFKENKLYTINYINHKTNIIELDINTKEKTIISNKDENPQVKTMIEDNIYYSSNYFENNYLIKQKIKSKDKVKKYFNNYFFNYLINYKNKIVAFVTNNSNHDFILEIDKDTLRIISKRKIPSINQNARPIIDNDFLYFISNNSLYINDLISKKNKIIKLTSSYPTNLKILNNKLYLNSINKLTMQSKSSKIEVIDLKKDKKEYLEADKIINNFIFKNNNVYLLHDNSISVYDLNFKKINEVNFDDNKINLEFLQ